MIRKQGGTLRPWTEEDERRLEVLAAQGVGLYDICEQLDRSSRRTNAMNTRPPRFAPEQRVYIRALVTLDVARVSIDSGIRPETPERLSAFEADLVHAEDALLAWGRALVENNPRLTNERAAFAPLWDSADPAERGRVIHAVKQWDADILSTPQGSI